MPLESKVKLVCMDKAMTPRGVAHSTDRYRCSFGSTLGAGNDVMPVLHWLAAEWAKARFD